MYKPVKPLWGNLNSSSGWGLYTYFFLYLFYWVLMFHSRAGLHVLIRSHVQWSVYVQMSNGSTDLKDKVIFFWPDHTPLEICLAQRGCYCTTGTTSFWSLEGNSWNNICALQLRKALICTAYLWSMHNRSERRILPLICSLVSTHFECVRSMNDATFHMCHNT